MDLDEEIKSREVGEIGSESREKGDLLPCSSPLLDGCNCLGVGNLPTSLCYSGVQVGARTNFCTKEFTI